MTTQRPHSTAAPLTGAGSTAEAWPQVLQRVLHQLDDLGRHRAPVRHGLILLVALGISTLAYLSPVQEHNSDGAGSLLASQALLDFGTLALDGYRGDPDLSYSLDTDYRMRRRGESSFYYSIGVPVISTPFVWLLDRAGLHMLHREHEDFAQNLLSALTCGAIFLLLYFTVRMQVDWLPALTIATVSTLGSSLVSTLATGLWNSGLAILLLTLALAVVSRQSRNRPGSGLAPAYLVGLSLLLGIAYLCRPGSAFFFFGLLAFVLVEIRNRRLALTILFTFLLAAVGVTLFAARMGWLLAYYDPRRLFFTDPSILTGLHGVLLSPSRGILVFSPFLVPVIVVAALALPRLRHSGLFWLCSVWIAVHVLAVATRKVWWGGHSYGPRMLAEVIPPFAVIAALAWQQWHPPRDLRRRAVKAYLLLAVLSILLHSGQGLLNEQVKSWNRLPDVDLHPETIFSWRYPQFLASAASLDRRRLEQDLQRIAPHALGEPLAFDAETAVFKDWYAAEQGWRWSRERSTIHFLLREVDERRLHLLELDISTPVPKAVDVLINGRHPGTIDLGAGQSRQRVLALPGTLLEAPGANRVTLIVTRAHRAPPDERRLGVIFRSLRLDPLQIPFPGVDFDDEPWFDRGWGDDEKGFRWSSDSVATLVYPLGPTERNRRWELVVETGALGTQTVEFLINGVSVGTTTISGPKPSRLVFPVSVDTLRAQSLNAVEIRIPGARSVGRDRRRLGIRFTSLQIRSHPLSQPSADGRR